jgi:PAS domain S-box-containing protein
MTAHISSLHDPQLLPDSHSGESESRELGGVLQKIVQNAGALLEVSSCSVALADISGSVLVTQAALGKHGQEPRHTRFQFNEGAAGWVAEHRTPLIINDVSLDTRFKRLGRVPIGSIMCVPLLDDERVIGTLTASSPETGAFSDRQLQMITIFAEQAVLAITNARHAELAQRQANQLEMLLDLSRSITTRLDADTLYRTILANIRRLVPCQSGLIYMCDAPAQELYPVAALALSPEQPVPDCSTEECGFAVTTANVQRERVSLHSTESVAAWAASHRHPMLHSPTPTASSSEGKSSQPPSIQQNLAEMAAPLVSKNVLYGVISLQRTEPFTSEELRLVRNLSNMAAAALENAELFDRVRADQEQLRAIVTASSDGIALLGANRCFTEANPAFGRIFGLEPEQVVGMECMELFCCEGDSPHPHEACRQICMIEQALQQDEPLSYIEIDVMVKGASRAVGLSITPISTMKQPFCLIIARDVTAVRDAARVKANFLSMITHELRSPINAIHGYLDLLLTGVADDLNEQQREFVQRARSSSEHLFALVEDLLLVSRADSGQIHLNLALSSLQEVVANAVEELELMALDHQVAVTVTVPRDFPPIYADAGRLQQVVRNLISNSLRFTPTGGQVTITASIEQQEQSSKEQDQEQDAEIVKLLRLQVIDTGSGIPLDQQERIFDRFYQVPHSGSGRAGGQGLGLAIVKMIVELHKGQVLVQSAPGAGSTFTCLIPCLLS